MWRALTQSMLIHGDNSDTGMKLAMGAEMSLNRCHVWGSDCVVWMHPSLRGDAFETRGKLAMYCGVDIARNCFIVYIPGFGLAWAHTCQFKDAAGPGVAARHAMGDLNIKLSDAEMAHFRTD